MERGYLRPASSLRRMQHIFFAIGNFFKWAFSFLSSIELAYPVILIARYICRIPLLDDAPSAVQREGA